MGGAACTGVWRRALAATFREHQGLLYPGHVGQPFTGKLQSTSRPPRALGLDVADAAPAAADVDRGREEDLTF